MQATTNGLSSVQRQAGTLTHQLSEQFGRMLAASGVGRGIAQGRMPTQIRTLATHLRRSGAFGKPESYLMDPAPQSVAAVRDAPNPTAQRHAFNWVINVLLENEPGPNPDLVADLIQAVAESAFCRELLSAKQPKLTVLLNHYPPAEHGPEDRASLGRLVRALATLSRQADREDRDFRDGLATYFDKLRVQCETLLEDWMFPDEPDRPAEADSNRSRQFHSTPIPSMAFLPTLGFNRRNNSSALSVYGDTPSCFEG